MLAKELTIDTINPANGERLHAYRPMSWQAVQEIIAAQHQAFLAWREWPLAERAACIRALNKLLLDRKHEYALLMANEMGKPLAQGVAEIEKCAMLCLHDANHAEKYLAPQLVKTDADKSYITYQPLGIVFGIMPWNFPFWQVFRFAVPALLAGNGALLKHAPISTGAALEIEKIFHEAGCLNNIFKSLVITNEVAAQVIAHPHVSGVTFTGSVAAGRIVATEAAKSLKKSVLELGGCDPYLILADADLELAAKVCVTSRMNNAGQTCIAAKRMIVVEEVQDQFIALVKQHLEKYVVGSPLESGTTCGPLAREDIRANVHAQVQQCIQIGAQLHLGGIIPDRPGFYYPPTLLTNVTSGMPAYDEEIFGPVVAIITAKDENYAIAIANQTSYGLGAAVFTRNIQRGEKIAAEQLQAGTCVVNMLVASDPRLPFGGIKHSGYGREMAAEGMHSFVNMKVVNVRKS